MDRVLAVLVAVVLTLGVTACSTPDGTASTAAGPGPYAAIPLDGQHEKDALAAVPSAMASVREAVSAAGGQVPDVASADPTLFSYMLEAVDGDRLVQFEVRADGTAHELNRYPSLPDPANLYWQGATIGDANDLAVPEGERETAAASAVRAVVGKAVPSDTVQVRMYGYTFCFVRDARLVPTAGQLAGPPFHVTIDPRGNAAAWSQ